MPVAEVNGIKTNYLLIESEGTPDAEYLVLIHGLSTNMAFWYMKHAMEYSKRFNVLIYDMRGHGRSTKSYEGYRPDNLANDLKELLDFLDINKVHLFAHSYGGVIALNFTSIYPSYVSSLAIADTHINLFRNPEKIGAWQYGSRLQRLLDQYDIDINVTDPYFGYKLLAKAASLEKERIEQNPELKEVLLPIIGNFKNRSAKQWLQLLESTKAEHELMDNDLITAESLTALSVPFLALYGEHSVSLISGQGLLSACDHGAFFMLRNAGHFFPTTRPQETIEIYTDWVTKLPISNPHRSDDECVKAYFRTNRFIEEPEGWSFWTREGKLGPFESKASAERELSTYLYRQGVSACER